MEHVIWDRLRNKGWSAEEIERAKSSFARPEPTARPTMRGAFVYWVAVLLTLVGNLILSVSLVPFFVAVEGFTLYMVVAVLAFTFGLLFEVLFRDLEHIDPNHGVLAGIVLPALAIVFVWVIVRIATDFKEALFGSVGQPVAFPNPVIITVVYVFFFILPYIVYQVLLRSTKKEGR